MFTWHDVLYNEDGNGGGDPPEDGGGGDGDEGTLADGDDPDKKKVPYSRFQEVVKAKDDLESEVDKMKKKLAGMEGAVAKNTGPLQDQIDELEGTLDDLKEQLDTTEAEREAARMKALRLEVATKAGIPAELAGKLDGETEEELADDAERLKAFLREDAPGIPPSGDGGAGSPSTLDIESMTPAEIREHADDLIEQARSGT